MAGPACKKLLNGVTAAIMESLEYTFTSPLVRDVEGMLSAKECDAYLDEMFTIDMRSYSIVDSDHPDNARTLLHIVSDLVDKGVVVPEIWNVLAKPEDV